MQEYSKLAAKRYRQYLQKKQRESFIQRLATFVLCILGVLTRTLRDAGVIKTRTVEKVNVD